MELILYITIILTLIYALIILLFVWGWINLVPFKNYDIKETVGVSIVIACRNEEKNISLLLNTLINQSYPKEKTEIIIVNDHSTDNTRNLISKVTEEFKYIHLLDLPEGENGKKEALAYGIEKAKSNILLTTDADCEMKPEWIKSMVGYYLKYKPLILAGPVTFSNPRGIFHKFQTLEFLSLIGSSAGAISINRAIMCNGANMLFDKSLYELSDTNKHIPSGDDIFLLLYAKKTKNSIHFIKSPNAIVYTNPVDSIKDFFNQRIRWVSKGRVYRDFDIIFTSLFVALSNLSILTCLIFSIWDSYFLTIFILLFTLKSITDLLMLIPTTKFFRQQNLLWLFLPIQFIYPFYIIITVIFGWLGNFTWKGRKLNKKRYF